MMPPILVINLDRSKARWANISQQLERLGLAYERVPGVDVSGWSEAEVEAVYDAARNRRHYLRSLVRGEIGCFLAHRRCWQMILERGWPYAVILEDDVTLSAGFPEALEFAFSHSDNWNYLRLADFRRRRRFLPCLQSHGFTVVQFFKAPGDTRGQIVSRSAAAQLLHLSHRFYCPVDVWLRYYFETGVEVLGLRPSVVFLGSESSRSEISNRLRSRLFGRQRMDFRFLLNMLRHAFSAKPPKKTLSRILRIALTISRTG